MLYTAALVLFANDVSPWKTLRQKLSLLKGRVTFFRHLPNVVLWEEALFVRHSKGKWQRASKGLMKGPSEVGHLAPQGVLKGKKVDRAPYGPEASPGDPMVSPGDLGGSRPQEYMG